MEYERATARCANLTGRAIRHSSTDRIAALTCLSIIP